MSRLQSTERSSDLVPKILIKVIIIDFKLKKSGKKRIGLRVKVQSLDSKVKTTSDCSNRFFSKKITL